MRVYEIMRPDPVSVPVGLDLESCRDRLAIEGQARAAAVDDEGMLRGVLTHEDLYWGLLFGTPAEAGGAGGLRVSDVMSAPAFDVDEDHDVRAACEILHRFDLGALPVTRSGRPVGWIGAPEIFDAVAAGDLVDPLDLLAALGGRARVRGRGPRRLRHA